MTRRGRRPSSLLSSSAGSRPGGTTRSPVAICTPSTTTSTICWAASTTYAIATSTRSGSDADAFCSPRMNHAAEVKEWLEARSDEMADLLMRLVAVNTENPPGRGLADCTAMLDEAMRALALAPEVIDI